MLPRRTKTETGTAAKMCWKCPKEGVKLARAD